MSWSGTGHRAGRIARAFRRFVATGDASGIRVTRRAQATAGWDVGAWLAIGGVYAVAGLAVGGHPQAPVIDDWLYAASVQDLLSTGRLQVGPISSVYPVFQILWGALFCAIFGFSFAVLRASTLCLATLGCVALFGTLRELGRERTVSLLAALTLALSPTFFLLSASFMTDVPFVAVSMVALFWLVTGLERDQPGRWWAGAACAIGAFLVRPLAIALPLAAAVGAWRAQRANLRWLTPLGLSCAAMLVLHVSLPMLLGPLDMAETRLTNIHYVPLVELGDYATWNAHMLVESAFPMAPLVVGALCSRRTASRIVLASLGVGIGLWLTSGTLPFPLPDAQTWSLRDMSARTLISCPDVARARWTTWIAPLLPVIGVAVAGGLATGAVAPSSGRNAHRGGGTIVVALAAAQWLLINLLWLYNDRYYIVFAPVLLYLATALAPRRVWITAPLVALWAVVSVTGTRDTLAFNDTIAATVRRLERSGVHPADIDAGWASNGWRLYAHPERLRPGADRTYDVPFVTSKASAPYRLANCPQPGYDLIQTIPLPEATWQATDSVLLLRKTSGGRPVQPSLAPD